MKSLKRNMGMLNNQLNLIDNFKERHLKQLKCFLEKKIGKPVCIKIKNNRFSMLYFSFSGSTYNLCLNEKFLFASDTVWNAIASFIVRKDKKSSKIINDFIKNYCSSDEKNYVSKKNLVFQGKYFNLKKIYNELNKSYFGNKLKTKISFGKNTKKRRVKYLQLGYYSKRDNLIVISKRLDKKIVPYEFIKFIVYHEMLHAYCDKYGLTPENRHHNKVFKELERNYEKYNLIKVIQKDLVNKL